MKRREAKRRWENKNRDKVRAYHRNLYRRWRAKNPGKYPRSPDEVERQYVSRLHNQTNSLGSSDSPEEVKRRRREYHLRYKAANPEKIRMQNQKSLERWKANHPPTTTTKLRRLLTLVRQNIYKPDVLAKLRDEFDKIASQTDNLLT